MIEALRDEFLFADVPDSAEKQSGLIFGQGEFEGIALDSMTIHDDGLVLRSRASTDFLERAYNHLIEVSRSRFDYEVVRTHKIDRFYKSSLVVESDRNLLSPLKGLEALTRAVQNALSTDTGISADYLANGFSVAADAHKLIIKPSPFRIERRVGVDFDFGHYASESPLKTDSHLAVLQLIEDELQ